MNKEKEMTGGDELSGGSQSESINIGNISDAGLKDLKDLKIIQQIMLQKEKKRLKKKYGNKHPLIKKLKKMDNRRIIRELEAEIGVCLKERDPVDKKEKVRSVELEDINGIGPSRKKKLEEKGIKDVELFAKADEKILKIILGNVNIVKMKKEAALLLKKKKGKR